MRPLSIFLLTAVIVVFVASAVSATIHVYPGESIQEALDASSNGELIVLHPGTFTGQPTDFYSITFPDHAVTLRGDKGPDSTFIHAAQIGLKKDHTRSTRIEGITMYLDTADPMMNFAILCDSGSSPTIFNCHFYNNICAIGVWNNASPLIEQCRFIENGHSDFNGGAVYAINGDPVLEDCYLERNVGYYGGAICTYGAEAHLTASYCLFVSNGDRTTPENPDEYPNQAYLGGTVGARASGDIDLMNCTIYGSYSNMNGTALLADDAHISMSRCIVAYSQAPTQYGDEVFYCMNGGSISASCCDIFGNAGGDYLDCLAGQGSSNNNFSQDPLFCDTVYHVFGLAPGSPCTGTNSPCSQLVGALDLGCEAYDGPNWHVALDGDDDTGDGSIDNPFLTIQRGIDQASNGEYVVVHDGVFNGPGNRQLDFKNKMIEVKSDRGNEYTIIDCDSLRGFVFDGTEDSNSVVTGFMIVNGAKEAIYCDATSPTFRDCIIRDCIRGVTCDWGASPIFEGCHFLDNQLPDNYNMGGLGVGAAVYCQEDPGTGMGSNPHFNRCIFEGNKTSAGAAVYCYRSSPLFTNCLFLRNGYENFTSVGAAIYVGDGIAPIVENCTFIGNRASTGSVIVVQLDGSIVLNNCLLAYNEVTDSLGRVVYCNHNGYATFTSCDIYGNSSGDWDGCIASQYGLTGNFSADPIFCDSTNDDFHLRGHSPCLPNHPLNSGGSIIGAYGVGCEGPVWVVAPWGDDIGGDGTYVMPFRTFQRGIDTCSAGDTVLATRGEFPGYENYEIDMSGKSIVITSEFGPDSTVLNLNNYGRGFVVGEFEDSTTVIDGLMIRGASQTAIYCDSAGPTITNCLFSYNHTSIDLWYQANARIRNCRFIDNVNQSIGASGIGIHLASPTVDSCYFRGNATPSGGAVYVAGSSSSPEFTYCQFIRNGFDLFQTSHGAAVEVFDNAQPWFDHCDFFANMAVGGPAIHTQDAVVTVEHSIIAYNMDQTFLGGGPVECLRYGDDVHLICCNVFGNSGGDFVNCLNGDEFADNNFSANPLFCDTTVNELALASNSLCCPEHSGCGQLVGALNDTCSAMSNTSTGTDVPVSPCQGVTMTFDEVTGEGQTDVIEQTSGPAPPSGFSLAPSDPAMYYSITSTASYTGDIEICIAYDEDNIVGSEIELTLMHFDGANWVDVKTSLDHINNIICGTVTSLSPFALATPDTSHCCVGIRGDILYDTDGVIDIVDLTYLVAYVFKGGDMPPCRDEANVNGIPEMLDILDVTYMVEYMFKSGPPPPACP